MWLSICSRYAVHQMSVVAICHLDNEERGTHSYRKENDWSIPYCSVVLDTYVLCFQTAPPDPVQCFEC